MSHLILKLIIFLYKNVFSMQKQNNIYHGIKKSLYPDKYGDAAISNHYIFAEYHDARVVSFF